MLAALANSKNFLHVFSSNFSWFPLAHTNQHPYAAQCWIIRSRKHFEMLVAELPLNKYVGKYVTEDLELQPSGLHSFTRGGRVWSVRAAMMVSFGIFCREHSLGTRKMYNKKFHTVQDISNILRWIKTNNKYLTGFPSTLVVATLLCDQGEISHAVEIVYTQFALFLCFSIRDWKKKPNRTARGSWPFACYPKGYGQEKEP